MHTLQSGAFWGGSQKKKSSLSGFFLGLLWLKFLAAFIIILLAPTLFQAVI